MVGRGLVKESHDVFFPLCLPWGALWAHSFRCRAIEQQNMLAFLHQIVWPGVAAERLKVLRTVLHGAPFKLRTPEELVLTVATVLPSLLVRVNEALVQKGLPGITDIEGAALGKFVDTCRSRGDSTMDSNSTPSSGSGAYLPASKVRVVGQ